jgi:hypothetical protein
VSRPRPNGRKVVEVDSVARCHRRKCARPVTHLFMWQTMHASGHRCWNQRALCVKHTADVVHDYNLRWPGNE